MTGIRKAAILLLAFVLLVILSMLAIELLVPRLINSDVIKGRIEEGVSKRLGGRVELGSVDISIFPRPHAVMERAAFDLPGVAGGTAASLKVYPRLLPLLAGDVRISGLKATGAKVSVDLPGAAIPAFTAAAVKKKLAQVMSALEAAAPKLVVTMDGGTAEFSREGRHILTIRDMDARLGLSPGGLSIDVAGASRLWGAMSLGAAVLEGGQGGRLTVEVEGLSPGAIVRAFLPGLPVVIGGSELDIALRAGLGSDDELAGELRGELRRLVLSRDGKETVITGRGLSGSFRIEDGVTRLVLGGLKLLDPEFDLAGSFTVHGETGAMALTLDAAGADIASPRKAAMNLAGDLSLVRRLFTVVKGGRIPAIRFETRGRSAGELSRAENFTASFTLKEGEITIPGPGLDITGVAGEMEIEGGLLTGEGLVGRLGGTVGKNTALRVGIKEGDVPLSLATDLTADLADLPGVLARLVSSDAFQKELSLIGDLAGRGRGRLELSGTTGSMAVRAGLSELNLRAAYRRVPWPVEIIRGRVSYEKDRVETVGLEGRVGSTAFSEIDAAFGTGPEPSVEITSGKATVSAGELHRIISQNGISTGIDKVIESVEGTVGLESIEIKGPLLTPRSWVFKAAGTAEGVSIATPFAPGTVYVDGGFEATEKRLALKRLRAETEETSVVVSGAVDSPLEGFRSGLLDLDGAVGPSAVVWLHERARLPAALRLRSPLSIDGARLGWKRGKELSFSGDMRVEKGPALSVDILRNGEGFDVRELKVRDDESDASIEISLREKERSLEAGFSGELMGSTLSRLLEDNTLLDGWIKGRVHLKLPLDRPWDFDAAGDLTGEGMFAPPGLGLPVEVERFSLRPAGRLVKVREAEGVWAGRRFSAAGYVEAGDDGLHMDIDASTEGFDWKDVKASFEEIKKPAAEEDDEDFPVSGNVRVRAGSFTHGKLKWSPFNTDVTLSPGLTVITVTEAELCGISTPGTIRVVEGGVDLVFLPFASGADLGETIRCATGKEGLATGLYDLSGRISSTDPRSALGPNLGGEMEFGAGKGRIFRFGLLAKVFALLNLTEIFRGELPDLTTSGFAYNSMTARGRFEGSEFILTEGMIDGATMEIVSEGTVDVVDRKMDLRLLVAPFKTVDYIVKKVPLLGEILGGNLVSIPVRVSGDTGDPKVEYMKAADIGSRVQGIMERTLKLPFRIIEPVIPGEREMKE